MAQVLEELAEEARSARAGSRRGRASPPSGDEAARRRPAAQPPGGDRQERRNGVVGGSHGLSRATGIALGQCRRISCMRPCAVLVARGSIDAERWPRRIVVGVDGSADSVRAVEAATALGARFDANVRAIVASKDARVDLDAAGRIAPGCEEHEARALDILNVASETADLIVVGSRGLRGIRALGSLSERIAHESRCSVLVVRSRTD